MTARASIRRKAGSSLAGIALTLVACSTASGQLDAGDRPNVLFIAVDDLNDWGMGLSDEYTAKTPHMDALARRGVLFSNAHCAAPVCSPSRVSVMTGVSPATSGVYQNNQDWRECSRLRDHVTLPQHFRNHGYKVIGGGKLYHAANLSEKMLMGYLDPSPWDEYFPSKQRQLPDEFIPAGNSKHGSNQFYGGRFDWDALDIDDAEMGDGKVVAWAELQLSRQHDKPLFLGVGIYRPHIPWYTPKKWFAEYPLDEVPLPTVGNDDLDDLPAVAKAMSKHTWHQWLVNNEKWDDAVQAYLASVSFADAMVGRLLSALDNGPLAEDTIVVLWSDHGYHLGHKQHWEKRVLWEQATHVPLLIADHRLRSAGQRCNRPVSLLDLYPTLIDLCELGPAKNLEGQSLKPLLLQPTAESGRLVCTTYKRGNHSVRSQNWRYIRYADGSEELYDHRIDPREFHNLAPDAAHEARKHRLAKGMPESDAGADPMVNKVSRRQDRTLTLGQGTMSGEVTESTVLLQTRLTRGTALDSAGDLPGSEGVASFEWSTQEDFSEAQRTPFKDALAKSDFIVRAQLTQLEPDTKYFYRAIYTSTESKTLVGPTCSFQTLPGRDRSRDVKFIVASCMNYNKFKHGRKGAAAGPVTATEEDKRLGFPAFEVMRKLQPDFFVGTGDIVYYDNRFRVSETTEELRRCWHEQFRFPRMIEFFRDVPAYWSKDDHDFRYNDSDNETQRLPLPSTGINLFHEQLPIAPAGTEDPKSYRTIRVSRDLQIWLTEGRDHRSPNDSPDGPQKSMWGKTQREWIKTTLAASDAQWKVIISPTPMVGPDNAKKKDNHASLQGFRHEADEFFQWVKKQEIDNLFLVCGDRHWQYHSIHPSGIHEFACGALNDENSRMGVPPRAKSGTDPDGKIQQPYSSPEPSGGFIEIEAGRRLTISFYNDEAKKLHRVQFPQRSAK